MPKSALLLPHSEASVSVRTLPPCVGLGALTMMPRFPTPPAEFARTLHPVLDRIRNAGTRSLPGIVAPLTTAVASVWISVTPKIPAKKLSR